MKSILDFVRFVLWPNMHEYDRIWLAVWRSFVSFCLTSWTWEHRQVGSDRPQVRLFLTSVALHAVWRRRTLSVKILLTFDASVTLTRKLRKLICCWQRFALQIRVLEHTLSFASYNTGERTVGSSSNNESAVKRLKDSVVGWRGDQVEQKKEQQQ